MPRMNGTGPMGQGPQTGRGRGPCADGERMPCCGRRRAYSMTPQDRLAALEAEEKALSADIEAVRAEKEALQSQI